MNRRAIASPRRRPFAAVGCLLLVAASAALGQEPTPLFDAAKPAAGLKNVVTVSASGGQFKTVVEALASITNASTSNRYMVFVGPGRYSGRVVMKPYVDLVGSGQYVTTLSATGGSSPQAAAVVRTATSSQIRSLTISNTGEAPLAVGVHTAAGTIGDLRDVFVATRGGTAQTYGIYSDGVAVALDLVSVSVDGGSSASSAVHVAAGGAVIYRSWMLAIGATGQGLYKASPGGMLLLEHSYVSGPIGVNLAAQVAFKALASEINGKTIALRCAGCIGYTVATIVAATSAQSRGVECTLGTLEIQGGQVSASGATVFAAPGTQVRVANALLKGGPAGGGGTLRCAGVTDESFAFYPNACP